jgi:hypothetical protein
MKDPEQDPSPWTDFAVLEALSKGTFWLKLKKLRALGYIEGPLPSSKLKVTLDGEIELQRYQQRKKP